MNFGQGDGFAPAMMEMRASAIRKPQRKNSSVSVCSTINGLTPGSATLLSDFPNCALETTFRIHISSSEEREWMMLKRI
jgi:hypothetical protein